MSNCQQAIVNNYIKRIRRSANIGLYGSLLICIFVVAEHYLDQYVWVREITTNEYTRRLFVIVALVLAVGTIAYSLFTMRKNAPKLRQTDGADQKLEGYAKIVVFLVGAVIVITHENVLIMLLMLLFVSLVLNYPNMYKIKADTGLNDDEMKEIFGEKYLG